MNRAAGLFTVTGGSEQTVREAPNEVKLTRVSGTQRFSGGIVADGSVEWLFCYRPDGSATFVGFQRIEGSIDGRSGSLILESIGDHAGGRSKGVWRVVPDPARRRWPASPVRARSRHREAARSRSRSTTSSTMSSTTGSNEWAAPAWRSVPAAKISRPGATAS